MTCRCDLFCAQIAPSPQYTSLLFRGRELDSCEAEPSSNASTAHSAERQMSSVAAMAEVHDPLSPLLPGASDELRTCGGELAFAIAMLLDALVLKDRYDTASLMALCGPGCIQCIYFVAFIFIMT